MQLCVPFAVGRTKCVASEISGGADGQRREDERLGLSTIAGRIDGDGTTRPQGAAYDAGAFEYKASTPPPSPPAVPRNLRITVP
jgi:hypothetical protein